MHTAESGRVQHTKKPLLFQRVSDCKSWKLNNLFAFLVKYLGNIQYDNPIKDKILPEQKDLLATIIHVAITLLQK